MDGHHRLHIWQLARKLVLAVYGLCKDLPSFELYITRSQLCRAAWSVQNNIAEGHAKLGKSERRRFFDISLGSLAEIDSVISTLPDLYNVDANLMAEIDHLRKQITAGIFKIIRHDR